MKNLICAVALVACFAACKTEKTSISDTAGANMPAAGCCDAAKADCSDMKKAECTDAKKAECATTKATCATKPQG